MSDLRTILVIVDPTASEHPAVEKAAALAQKCGARIELYVCETKESRALRYAKHLEQGGDADFVAHIRAVVEALAKPLRERGLSVGIEVDQGDPLHAKLLERTKTTCAELVIKDTHHHSLIRRTIITNTDWHLIRGCPVPLLLVKPRAWADKPVILAAVDPGHVNDKPVVLDNRILELSRQFQQRLDGQLNVVHAYLPALLLAEAAGGMPAMGTAITPELMEDERKRALASVQALAGQYGIDNDRVQVQLGTASDVLPDAAQETNADVVVMGAISRSGLKRIFIGSTAERVLDRLPCDVCIVKPPEFADAFPY